VNFGIRRNPDPKGKIFTPEQVEELGVSKGIVDMMREMANYL
jgi:hypothetical protein